MKKFLLILLVCFVLFFSGCNSEKKVLNNKEENGDEVVENVDIIINGKIYRAFLENNETVRKFVSHLPLKLDMSELNGNEKYIYLDFELPVNDEKTRHINSGDIMLFGNNCLVIFYKSFDTTYNYTKIGHINNLDDMGTGNISLEFRK